MVSEQTRKEQDRRTDAVTAVARSIDSRNKKSAAVGGIRGGRGREIIFPYLRRHQVNFREDMSPSILTCRCATGGDGSGGSRWGWKGLSFRISAHVWFVSRDVPFVVVPNVGGCYSRAHVALFLTRRPSPDEPPLLIGALITWYIFLASPTHSDPAR